jgi:exodeoxyribonuclease VII large subunit
VSAVGHEVDITLVDFAADARAATPSQAAEMIVPDQAGQRRLLDERTRRLERAIRAKIAEERAASERLLRAFGDPRLLIASAQQRIDDLTMRLGRVTLRRLANEKETTATLTAQLRAQHPQARIARDRATVATLVSRLRSAGQDTLRARSQEAAGLGDRLVRAAPRLVRDRTDIVVGLAGRLDAMSPLKVLGRGYAIVTREGHAVRDANEVTAGDRVHVRVGAGDFDATVTKDEK